MTRTRVVALALCVLGSPPIFAQGDTSIPELRYHFEPWPLEAGQTVFGLGLSLTLLPEPVVESEVPAPALDLQFKVGLSEHFSVVTQLSTNVVSNVLQAGVQWNTREDRTSLAIGNNLVGFAGWFSDDGMFRDNSAFAFGTIPIVRIGHRFADFSLSTSFAAVFLVAAQSNVGRYSAPGPALALNDVFVTLAVEQPFLTSSAVSTGISLAFSRTPYQSWVLFNTVDQYLLLPEFFVSFQL